MDRQQYESYISLLHHEMVPALGCTEPIAIAFAVAKARETLGCFPERIRVHLSGNILKNARSVIVPNSKGQRGIAIAAVLGCVGGDASLGYEVLRTVTEADIERARTLAANGFCETALAEGRDNLYIRAEVACGGQSAWVTVEREHTRVTEIAKNGRVVFRLADVSTPAVDPGHTGALSVRGIWDFAEALNLDDVRGLLERAVALNTAISEEGLKGGYGEAVGQAMMHFAGGSVEGRAAARAAAGSDARMNGCSMPVVINSGSGNQGIAVTLPVCEFARTWEKSSDDLLRALAISNLISVHIKRQIGNLSAFCGAVSAACGAACAIGWLDGCTYEQICMIITNTLCNVGGIVCDGAKSSCAAKIASSVNAGLLAFHMAREHRAFQSGEGLVGDDIEQTISNIARMGRKGMRSTDQEILKIMTEVCHSDASKPRV